MSVCEEEGGGARSKYQLNVRYDDETFIETFCLSCAHKQGVVGALAILLGHKYFINRKVTIKSCWRRKIVNWIYWRSLAQEDFSLNVLWRRLCMHSTLVFIQQKLSSLKQILFSTYLSN